VTWQEEKQNRPAALRCGPARLIICLFACRSGELFLGHFGIGLTVTAGLPLFGSTTSRFLIWLSVFTPTIFPNTGAVIDTATLTFSADAALGTLPVYAHTPPQPYSIVDEDAIREPFSMVTVGGLAFPVLVKSIGPYISEPDPTTETAPADKLTLPAL
jgi:hypothetical protein